MERFDSRIHRKYAKNLPFAYTSLPIYLDMLAYTFERNGEHLILWQDLIFPNDFPSIFLPTNKLNHERASVAFATKEDIEIIKKEKIEIKFSHYVESEYIYKTKDLIEPNSKINRRIRQFEKSYTFKTYETYSKDKIEDFYTFWKSQRERVSITSDESDRAFFWILDKLNDKDIRQIYVEVDDKLVGFAWGMKHPFYNGWVGLHLKVNYEYKGLSRFLHQKRAEMFKEFELFTIGTGSHDPGIAQFKKELGPSEKIDYYYVLTGDRIK